MEERKLLPRCTKQNAGDLVHNSGHPRKRFVSQSRHQAAISPDGPTKMSRRHHKKLHKQTGTANDKNVIACPFMVKADEDNLASSACSTVVGTEDGSSDGIALGLCDIVGSRDGVELGRKRPS